MIVRDFKVDTIRTDGVEEIANLVGDEIGPLPRYETEAKLGAGLARNDGLAPLALVTGSEAVDLGGGTDPEPLHCGIARFARQPGRTRGVEDRLVVEGDLPPALRSAASTGSTPS